MTESLVDCEPGRGNDREHQSDPCVVNTRGGPVPRSLATMEAQ